MAIVRFTRALRPLAAFYRSFAPAGIAVSIGCMAIFYNWGAGSLGMLVILKALSDAAIVFLINEYSARRYYFYHNLGLSKRRLWCCSLAADLLLLALALMFIALLR